MSENKVWMPTTVPELDTKDWRGNTIRLKDVPAIKNTKTGKIGFDPSQVTLAQMIQIAKEFGIDLTLLLENLALTPTERLQKLCAAQAFYEELRRAGEPKRAR